MSYNLTNFHLSLFSSLFKSSENLPLSCGKTDRQKIVFLSIDRLVTVYPIFHEVINWMAFCYLDAARWQWFQSFLLSQNEDIVSQLIPPQPRQFLKSTNIIRKVYRQRRRLRYDLGSLRVRDQLSVLFFLNLRLALIQTSLTNRQLLILSLFPFRILLLCHLQQRTDMSLLLPGHVPPLTSITHGGVTLFHDHTATQIKKSPFCRSISYSNIGRLH